MTDPVPPVAPDPEPWYQRFINKVANEPVVVTAGGLTSAATWFLTFIGSGWDPSQHAYEIGGLASAAAFLVSLVARQFVTPVRKK